MLDRAAAARGVRGGRAGGRRRERRASCASRVIPKALDIPVFNYAKIGAERAAKELGNVEVIWNAPETADQLKQKEILESFITQRVDGIAISCAQRRLPHRDDQPRDRRGHSGRHLGLRRAEVEAHRVLRRRRLRVGPHHGRGGDQAAERQGQGRDHHQPRRRPTCSAGSTA